MVYDLPFNTVLLHAYILTPRKFIFMHLGNITFRTSSRAVMAICLNPSVICQSTEKTPVISEQPTDTSFSCLYTGSNFDK